MSGSGGSSTGSALDPLSLTLSFSPSPGYLVLALLTAAAGSYAMISLFFALSLHAARRPSFFLLAGLLFSLCSLFSPVLLLSIAFTPTLSLSSPSFTMSATDSHRVTEFALLFLHFPLMVIAFAFSAHSDSLSQMSSGAKSRRLPPLLTTFFAGFFLSSSQTLLLLFFLSSVVFPIPTRDSVTIGLVLSALFCFTVLFTGVFYVFNTYRNRMQLIHRSFPQLFFAIIHSASLLAEYRWLSESITHTFNLDLSLSALYSHSLFTLNSDTFTFSDSAKLAVALSFFVFSVLFTIALHYSRLISPSSLSSHAILLSLFLFDERNRVLTDSHGRLPTEIVSSVYQSSASFNSLHKDFRALLRTSFDWDKVAASIEAQAAANSTSGQANHSAASTAHSIAHALSQTLAIHSKARDPAVQLLLDFLKAARKLGGQVSLPLSHLSPLYPIPFHLDLYVQSRNASHSAGSSYLLLIPMKFSSELVDKTDFHGLLQWSPRESVEANLYRNYPLAQEHSAQFGGPTAPLSPPKSPGSALSVSDNPSSSVASNKYRAQNDAAAVLTAFSLHEAGGFPFSPPARGFEVENSPESSHKSVSADPSGTSEDVAGLSSMSGEHSKKGGKLEGLLSSINRRRLSIASMSRKREGSLKLPSKGAPNQLLSPSASAAPASPSNSRGSAAGLTSAAAAANSTLLQENAFHVVADHWVRSIFDYYNAGNRDLPPGLYVGMFFTRIRGTQLEIMIKKSHLNAIPMIPVYQEHSSPSNGSAGQVVNGSNGLTLAVPGSKASPGGFIPLSPLKSPGVPDDAPPSSCSQPKTIRSALREEEFSWLRSIRGPSVSGGHRFSQAQIERRRASTAYSLSHAPNASQMATSASALTRPSFADPTAALLSGVSLSDKRRLDGVLKQINQVKRTPKQEVGKTRFNGQSAGSKKRTISLDIRNLDFLNGGTNGNKSDSVFKRPEAISIPEDLHHSVQYPASPKSTHLPPSATSTFSGSFGDPDPRTDPQFAIPNSIPLSVDGPEITYSGEFKPPESRSPSHRRPSYNAKSGTTGHKSEGSLLLQPPNALSPRNSPSPLPGFGPNSTSSGVSDSEELLLFQADFLKAAQRLQRLLGQGSEGDLLPSNLLDTIVVFDRQRQITIILFTQLRLKREFPPQYDQNRLFFVPLHVFEGLHRRFFHNDLVIQLRLEEAEYKRRKAVEARTAKRWASRAWQFILRQSKEAKQREAAEAARRNSVAAVSFASSRARRHWTTVRNAVRDGRIALMELQAARAASTSASPNSNPLDAASALTRSSVPLLDCGSDWIKLVVEDLRTRTKWTNNGGTANSVPINTDGAEQLKTIILSSEIGQRIQTSKGFISVFTGAELLDWLITQEYSTDQAAALAWIPVLKQSGLIKWETTKITTGNDIIELSADDFDPNSSYCFT